MHDRGPHGRQSFASLILLGLAIGVFLCAIPFIVLLRKIRRLKKKGKHGRMHPGEGRWHFQEHGPARGFPEYETEHLLKSGYEAPLDF